MKKLLTLFILFSSINIYADWIPYSTDEAIEAAEIIVIADYTKEVKETKADENNKWQVVKFKTNRILKGNIEETFYVNGMMTVDCLPQVYFYPQNIGKTYILFLSKDTSNIFYNIFFHQTYTPISEYAFHFDANLYNTTNQEMTIQKLKKFLNEN